jgi:hypothetical protein
MGLLLLTRPVLVEKQLIKERRGTAVAPSTTMTITILGTHPASSAPHGQYQFLCDRKMLKACRYLFHTSIRSHFQSEMACKSFAIPKLFKPCTNGFKTV